MSLQPVFLRYGLLGITNIVQSRFTFKDKWQDLKHFNFYWYLYKDLSFI